ncbi:MAG: hypothetical protein AAF716_09720 [Cyanobacteria bacterium P01_D01_bin.1]
MESQQEHSQETQQNLQQRINQQRVQHIVDSYLLASSEPKAFETYLRELLHQYPHGLIELALVDTLIKSWLTIPMQKGVPFLAIAHQQIKQWQIEQQQSTQTISLTRSQFRQITGLDPNSAFAALEEFRPQPAPTATESTS